MTSAFFTASMRAPFGAGRRGGPVQYERGPLEPLPLHPEPLRLPALIVIGEADDLPALHLVQGDLRAGTMIGRRVRHGGGQAAEVEVLQRLERGLDALPRELAGLV